MFSYASLDATSNMLGILNGTTAFMTMVVAYFWLKESITLKQIFGILLGFLGILILVIGMGTLIAGVVGISNIMIFIVKERTKEIGIRKALGASPKSIVSIILIESILITTLAGYLGLLAGVGILEWASPVLKTYFITDPSVSKSLVISATLTLIGAGTLAGYLPAQKASKIKPIVALRDD
jgi:putative ABC transport system permease protein